ncbi:Putative CbiX family protein (fragment) [metagenome]|uniref:CbiX family protein n=1 Tax=metagenome TaxID=256318 RepID=A0A2P2C0D0_9ZZZZ
MTLPTPRLVTVAHGTRHPEGNDVARMISAQAGRRLGGLPTISTYVELCEPSFGGVMASNEHPAVVVPLLLSTGHHVRHDLPSAAAGSLAPVRMARPLGPHPLLAEVMCRNLMAAGARRGDPVVMVAAGSNDPASTHDLAVAGAMLGKRWGAPVRVATVGGLGRRPVDVIAGARAHGRVVIAPYLLAPGHFEQRVRTIAAGLGVSVVGDIIGAHSLVADLVVRRYRALAADSLAA